MKERPLGMLIYPCHWTHLRSLDVYPSLPVERPNRYLEGSGLCRWLPTWRHLSAPSEEAASW